MKKKSMMIEGLLFGVMGIALAIYSTSSNAKVMQQYWSISPYMMSTVIAVVMIVLGVSFFVKGIKQRNHSADTNETTKQEQKKTYNWKGVFCTMAMVILYLVLLPLLHFLPTTVIFLLGFLFYLGERKPLRLILIPLITSGVLYVLFGMLLNVMLP